MMGAQEVIRDSLVSRIYDINEKDFGRVALEVWKYQYDFNLLYRAYCDLLGVESQSIRELEDIPYLPIGMFRQHEVKTGEWEAERIFTSSGTTGSKQSRHLVRDLSLYHKSAELCFASLFGKPHDYTWLGLLPSYLERTDSSLVDMVHYFMSCSNQPDNGFYPKVGEDIVAALGKLKASNVPVILIGVSFAILDLFENFDVPVWDGLVVMETGGMKGRGQEITREELINRITKRQQRFRLASEYGMTELLSQAYRRAEYYQPGPTMRVRIRDVSDPLKLIGYQQRGGINIIDLANVDTCSFIATDDVGILYPDERFDVLGRLDNSDLRGCNLLYV